MPTIKEVEVTLASNIRIVNWNLQNDEVTVLLEDGRSITKLLDYDNSSVIAFANYIDSLMEA